MTSYYQKHKLLIFRLHYNLKIGNRNWIYFRSNLVQWKVQNHLISRWTCYLSCQWLNMGCQVICTRCIKIWLVPSSIHYWSVSLSVLNTSYVSLRIDPFQCCKSLKIQRSVERFTHCTVCTFQVGSDVNAIWQSLCVCGGDVCEGGGCVCVCVRVSVCAGIVFIQIAAHAPVSAHPSIFD